MAVLAVLVVSFAGLLSEARMTTILLRDVLGFVVAGTVVYLVMFLLEAKDIVLFVAYAFHREPISAVGSRSNGVMRRPPLHLMIPVSPHVQNPFPSTA